MRTLFVEIREAAKAGYNKKELMRTFHVGRATLLQALEAPTPRPWRSPFKKNPPAYVAVIEEIRETHPELNPVQIWMAIINGTEGSSFTVDSRKLPETAETTLVP